LPVKKKAATNVDRIQDKGLIVSQGSYLSFDGQYFVYQSLDDLKWKLTGEKKRTEGF
jgi:hypothetical protein